MVRLNTFADGSNKHMGLCVHVWHSVCRAMTPRLTAVPPALIDPLLVKPIGSYT